MAARLIERELELEVFDTALASARSGVGQVVVVEAPAGCGKSSLLSAALRRATGFRTLAGRGGEFERAAGFGVVRDLYGAVTAEGPADRLLAGAAKIATPLVGADAAAAAALDAAALNHGLYWLTANLVAERPLVLAVDDAHWADSASLRYLEYLAARIDSLACLLVLAWRPGEPGSDEGFVGRVLELGDSIHVRPKPLTRAGSRALVLSRLAAGVSEELIDRWHEASAGNPFLLHELASAVTAGKAKPEEGHLLAWLAGGSGRAAGEAVPERLTRIVRARLARLPGAAGALAEALALLGPDAALRHAAGIAGVSDEEAARAADALTAADLIRPGARICFVHPLLRRAVYDMQPASSRAEAHGRAARMLAAEQADSEVIAGHLLLAPARGDGAVARDLMSAARTALERGAPDAAVTYLLRAQEEPPAGGDRVEALRALGSAEVRAGKREGVSHLQEAHARSPDPRERLEIALEIAHAAMGFEPARVDDLTSGLPAALAECADGDPDTAMLARTLLLGVSVPTADAGWRTNVEQARAMYRSAAEGFGRRVLAAALAFAALWSNEPAEDVRSLARSGLGDDEAYEESLAAGWQLAWCCPALAVAGEWELAERRLTQALLSGQDRGSPRAARNALWGRMAVRALRGDAAGAESDGRQALALHEDATGHPVMVVMFGWCLIELLIDRASPAAAQALLRELGLEGDDLDQPAATAQLLWSRSRLRLVEGRPAAALADLEVARELLARAGLNPVALFSVEERAAGALAALGRRQEARAAAAEALRLARVSATPAAIGTSLRAGALLERGPEQVRKLTAAVELLASSGRAIEHARALIDLGAAMRRQAERAAARGPLSRGRELAHRCGVHALEERARQELRATGARPRRIMLSGVESLTASERRVAEMAADGLPTRVIAEQLFVTEKTVETHLGHVYRKLDIPGRQQIAQALSGEAPHESPPGGARRQTSGAVPDARQGPAAAKSRAQATTNQEVP